MTFAPKELLDLQAYWKAQGGVSLGIVGDTSHQNKGTSYHLGKDNLVAGAYSARTARDKAGLTNAASAFDLGRLDGSLTKLRDFSAWFAAQCRAQKPAFNDVREVIWWDRQSERVFGWSDLDPKKFIPGYGDMSHKTHTHVSFYRDSEKRDKTAMFKPYFVVAPVPLPPEADMPPLSVYLPGYTTVVKKTSNIRETPSITGKVIRNLSTAPETWVVAGRVKGGVDPEGGSDQWYTRWFNSRWEYTAFSNCSTPLAPASAADLAAAQAALSKSQSDLSACNTKVSNAKTALG